MGFLTQYWVGFLQLFSVQYYDPASHQRSLSKSFRFPGEVTGLEDGQKPLPGPGPKFPAPPSPIDEPFVCDYTAMGARWKACSTSDDRGCWLKDTQFGQDFNITSDYETRWPTGVTRRYKLDVTSKTLNQDGVSVEEGLVFNDRYPGPWIRACWGDDVEITVTNSLKKYNGTTIHWHGVRQLNNFQNDGVNGVTQCPIAPGKSFTYRFKVTQYGTSWYHSHYSVQYANGLLGPMTFFGPSSANYDEPIKPTLITDWNHKSAFQDLYAEYSPNGPPNMTSILLNGIGNYAGTDKRGLKYEVVYQQGKKYLMRIINTSVDTTFVFTIDNHLLEVMSSDFVPITPYKNESIVVGIGQRYHVVVEALRFPAGTDLALQNFWIRTIPATFCNNFELGNDPDERQGIVRYDNASTEIPTSYRYNVSLLCRDEPYEKLQPVVPWTVSKTPANADFERGFDVGIVNASGEPPRLYGIFQRWALGNQPLWTDFGNPLILNTQNETFDPKWVVIPEEHPADAWVYMLIVGDGTPRPQTGNPMGRQFIPAAHPIHLHGHDFVLLQQSTDKYVNASTSLKLKWDNPPRRDVVLLPRLGFVVIAFKADNPGAWLIHCHIAWHASSGLAMQILERASAIKEPLFKPGWLDQTERGCAEWKQWFADPANRWNPEVELFQDDSGI